MGMIKTDMVISLLLLIYASHLGPIFLETKINMKLVGYYYIFLNTIRIENMPIPEKILLLD